MPAMILLFFCTMVHADVITVYSTSAGDGFYHNELGTSYDFFDSTGTNISCYYYYDPYTGSSSVQQNTGYIQFSLAAFTTETLIGSATLNVYLNNIFYRNDSPTAGSINFVANSSGANGTASQKLGGTVQVVQMKDQSVGWLSLDVTSLIQSCISNSYPYACFSFNYETDGYSDNNGFSINSADAVVNKPYLSASVIPEPASAVLLVFGASVGIIMRRQRRNALRQSEDQAG